MTEAQAAGDELGDERARQLQRIWAAVPPSGRARVLRRSAQAILDQLDGLADTIARHTGRPRTDVLLSELLPSVRGLHALADDGPSWLADRRRGRELLVHAPRGIVGVAGTDPSPWLGPALETGAGLLAGNAVVLAPSAVAVGERLRTAFEQGGAAEGLVRVLADGDASELDACCDAVIPGPPAGRKGTMLLLAGAPLEPAVAAALWAAFAGAGRGPAAVGRIVVSGGPLAGALLERLERGARRLVVDDPLRAETEVGPLATAESAERVRALVDEAVAGGATLLCGGPTTVAGAQGSFFAPALLRGVPPDAGLLSEPVPGPVLAVVEAADDQNAIALVADRPGSTVSVWSADRAVGERVARALPAALTWVGDHGVWAPGPEVRLAAHVLPREIATPRTTARPARWLPHDQTLVAAATAASRLLHGRERNRLRVLRGAAGPLATTAARRARAIVRRG